jgi:hypothetical protein
MGCSRKDLHSPEEISAARRGEKLAGEKQIVPPLFQKYMLKMRV